MVAPKTKGRPPLYALSEEARKGGGCGDGGGEGGDGGEEEGEGEVHHAATTPADWGLAPDHWRWTIFEILRDHPGGITASDAYRALEAACSARGAGVPVAQKTFSNLFSREDCKRWIAVASPRSQGARAHYTLSEEARNGPGARGGGDGGGGARSHAGGGGGGWAQDEEEEAEAEGEGPPPPKRRKAAPPPAMGARATAADDSSPSPEEWGIPRDDFRWAVFEILRDHPEGMTVPDVYRALEAECAARGEDVPITRRCFAFFFFLHLHLLRCPFFQQTFFGRLFFGEVDEEGKWVAFIPSDAPSPTSLRRRGVEASRSL